MNDIKLTQFSHGAGCGCKIAPGLLSEILQKEKNAISFPGLLVGNETNDDAAVFDIGGGKAIVSTTDFFMPIVDDPEEFGAIASVNAISDVYAMGAKPLMAIAILGWPINTIPVAYAGKVLDGARKVCLEAGIPLAGGHSIDSPEPIFGLAVTGIVDRDKIKYNSNAREGDFLFLTKPLGVGILTTAQKKGLVEEAHLDMAKKSMLTLNKIGEELADMEGVHAMTDVTGFGLLGHLIEMCEAAQLSAELYPIAVPSFNCLASYLEKSCFPGGTVRNLQAYGHKVKPLDEFTKYILADPQTSGGLLLSVHPSEWEKVSAMLSKNGITNAKPIGKMIAQQDYVIVH